MTAIWKTLVRTPPGIYPPRAGKQKPLFCDRLWTLTELDVKNRKYTYQSTGIPYIPPNLMNFGPETAENGWRVFAHPLNFRIERHCQPYRMDVI